MTERIVLCLACGQKNRLSLPLAGEPNCGRCGKPLPLPSGAVPKPRSTDQGRQADFEFTRTSIGLFALILGGAAFFTIYTMANNTSGDGGDRAAPSTSQARDDSGSPERLALPRSKEDPLGIRDTPSKPTLKAPAFSLPPIEAKPGVIFSASSRKGRAPFEIRTSPGADYYVKLEDAVSGDEIIGIYVRGGVPLEVKVPVGNYKMKYASGEVWYGREKGALFGPKTTTYASSEIFDFRKTPQGYTGYTVELITQENGNFETFNIDPDQF